MDKSRGRLAPSRKIKYRFMTRERVIYRFTYLSGRLRLDFGVDVFDTMP